MDLYGTYLNYLFLKELEKVNNALSVREVARKIHAYESAREQRNFEDRLRRAAKSLKTQNKVTTVVVPAKGNINVTKYKAA